MHSDATQIQSSKKSRTINRKGLLLSVLLALLLLASPLCFKSAALGSIVAGKISSESRRNGLPVWFKEPRASIFGLESSQVELHPKNVPFGIMLSDFNGKLNLLRTIAGKPVINIQSQLYAGEIALNFFPNLNRSEKISARGVDLAHHPLIAAAGIKSAKMDLQLPVLAPDSPDDFEALYLSITQIEKPGQTSLPQSLTGSPFLISIPAFNAGSIKLDLSKGGSSKSYQLKLAINCSLGGLELSGGITHLEKGRDPRLSLGGEVKLTEAGHRLAGDYLPLIGVAQSARSFPLRINGPLSKPSISYK